MKDVGYRVEKGLIPQRTKVIACGIHGGEGLEHAGRETSVGHNGESGPPRSGTSVWLDDDGVLIREGIKERRRQGWTHGDGDLPVASGVGGGGVAGFARAAFVAVCRRRRWWWRWRRRR